MWYFSQVIPLAHSRLFLVFRLGRSALASLTGLIVLATHAAPLAPPSITTEPNPVSLRAGARLALSVRAAGTAPLTYGWRHNSNPIPGATNDTYVVEAVAAEDAGTYSAVVSNKYGLIFSRDVEVKVFSPPTITEGPRPKIVEAGDYFILDAQATGTPPLFFHWWRDGAPISPGSEINYFSVAPATAQDGGLYSVIASNRWGTATSQVVRVTVTPAPPNPDYLGRRFVALARTGDPVTRSAMPLGSVATTFGARWSGREVLFAGLSSAQQPLGILSAGLGGIAVRIPPNLPLPNSLGVVAQGYALPGGARSDDPLFVLASTNTTYSGFQGLYRWDGTTLVPLVDRKTPVPEAPGESFVGFSEAVQHGNAIAVVGYTRQRQGLYVWSDGILRRWLDTTQELPVAGHQAEALYALGWDGTMAAVALWSSRVGFVAAVRTTAEASVSAFLERGDRVPGTDRPIQDLQRIVLDKGTIYAATSRSSDAFESIVEWRDGVLSSRLHPGTVVDAWGGVATFDGGSFTASDGQIFAAAGPVPSYYAIRTDPDGHQRLFVSRKLDGAVVQGTYPLCVEAGRVALFVPFGANGVGIYANLPSVLQVERGVKELRLTIPAGHSLEQSAGPTGPWQTLEAGAGTFPVPTTSPSSYYRLREP